MTGVGVREAEWRKVSNCAGALEAIRPKYTRLLKLMAGVVAEQVHCVPGLSFELNEAENTAVLKSFAGESSIRLGWDASGEDLAGVAVFSSVRHGFSEPVVLLKVRMPAWSETTSLQVDGSEPVRMGSFGASDFAYTVLMNVVRKQVDISTQ